MKSSNSGVCQLIYFLSFQLVSCCVSSCFFSSCISLSVHFLQFENFGNLTCGGIRKEKDITLTQCVLECVYVPISRFFFCFHFLFCCVTHHLWRHFTLCEIFQINLIVISCTATDTHGSTKEKKIDISDIWGLGKV